MFNEACLAINRSSIVNPRSSRIKSPGFILSKNPLFSIIALSLIEPSKRSELSGNISLSLSPLMDQLVFVACCLVNFQEPLVK
jgi:hypothetical protein